MQKGVMDIICSAQLAGPPVGTDCGYRFQRESPLEVKQAQDRKNNRVRRFMLEFF